MLESLKKLIGVDEESKKQRQKIREQEEKERAARVRANKQALKQNVESEKRN